MADVVGVRFKRAGKVYYFDPAGIDLKVGDYVVVETARGLELGQVVISPRQVLASEITEPLKPVVRQAEAEDIEHAHEFEQKEREALVVCGELIAKLSLPMKLLSAEYNLDGSRLTFFFSAGERVDFRQLVRELTSRFKTRVELRQVGTRDEAKLIGGFGRCGRPLCCASFLSEIAPVSIRMAKEQGLPLNPMKISGCCGRLLCCLVYETELYHEMKEKLPKEGERVSTPMGGATVIGVNPLKETVMVELESQAAVELPVDKVVAIEHLPSHKRTRKQAKK
jgi:cell fate regulator YaaT (PSP1 superfamily)